jgi:hypothetical protein
MSGVVLYFVANIEKIGLNISLFEELVDDNQSGQDLRSF